METPRKAAVTWLGHASAQIEIGGERLLVDPLLRSRHRNLEGYRAILITHSHIDHLNRWTLKCLDREARLIIPKGARPIVEDLGFSEVVEIEPGDQLEVGSVEVSCVETRHDNGRWRKGDAPLCTGYVLGHQSTHIHHAGDIDMSDHEVFDDIGKRFDIDLTLLPIGGMLPVWYYRMRRKAIDRGVHIDPDTALDIFERLGARTMIPVHWGTVNLRLGPPSMPRRRLAKVAGEEGAERVAVLKHGEMIEILGDESDPRITGDTGARQQFQAHRSSSR